VTGEDALWQQSETLEMVASVNNACAGWAFDQEGIVRDVPASVNKVGML